MHGALAERTPVLSLTENSLASLGDLDTSGLSDLWGVFTKCKDSLQNGRRLENLSWRLWFDEGRRESAMYAEKSAAGGRAAPVAASRWAEGTPAMKAQEAGWSDPEEWTEAEDSESDEEELEASTARRPSMRRTSTERTKTNTPPPSSTFKPSLAFAPYTTTSQFQTRPPTSTRPGASCPRPTISGGSLQRMITGLTTLPAITPTSKARSAVDVSPPSELPSPSLPSRGASAPTTPALTLPSPTIPVSAPIPAVVSPLPPTSVPSTKIVSPTLHSPAMTRSSSGAGAAILAKSLSLKRSASKSTTSASPRPEARQRLSGTGIPTTSAIVRKSADPAPLQRTLGSAVQLTRNASTASFEPRSLVKGFDTTVFESRPQQGSIAPPPTPAPAPPSALGPSPPSALKSAFKKPGPSKKIFFISSHSDSDEDLSSSHSHSGDRHASTSRVPYTHNTVPAPPSPSPASAPSADATPSRSKQKNEEEDEWDDEESEDEEDDEEDEDDEDASSGWGSDYSTESDAPTSRRSGGKGDKKPALFAKRPTTAPVEGQLRPRGPGLLSQLFHPDLLLDETDRRHSTVDMTRHKSLPALHTSKSAGVLTEQLRNKSFLRGAPAGTEMESSSDEDSSDEYEDEEEAEEEEEEEESPPIHTVAQALARHQRRIEAAGPIAPPQTPRTTRRAMLATELSESLRRNLLWERQTRNRVMGGPPNRFQAQPHAATVAPAQAARPSTAMGTTSAQSTAAALAPPKPSLQTAFDGLRAPHPSPATRHSSPVNANMVRRHTTGTGLYLAAQTGMLAKGRSPDSDSGGSSREEAYGGAFDHGVHNHGW